MLEIPAAQRFFSDLNDLRIPYFVVAGLAYDGLEGRITREHKDIDLYVFDEHLVRLIDNIEGYDFTPGATAHSLTGPGIDVDLLPLKDIGGARYRRGSKADIWYPAAAFKNGQPSKIPDLRFTIARNEVLLAMATYGKSATLEKAKKLEIDQALFEEIIVRPLTRM
jgi:hypothetical protein